MLGLSGKIETFTPDMIDECHRLADRYQPGGRLVCPDRGAFFGKCLPESLVRFYWNGNAPRPDRGLIGCIGLFNWTDQPRRISVTRAAEGIDAKARITDFWTDKPVSGADATFITADLPPRGSMLFEIR
jgi:hypothetical protein